MLKIHLYYEDEQFTNNSCVKDVPGGFPKSDLLGVTVALIYM